MPLARKFPKYFNTKSKQLKRKFLGRLDLEKLYLDFVCAVRDTLFVMTAPAANKEVDSVRQFDEGLISMDFEVCQQLQCAETTSTQTIRRQVIRAEFSQMRMY